MWFCSVVLEKRQIYEMCNNSPQIKYDSTTSWKRKSAWLIIFRVVCSKMVYLSHLPEYNNGPYVTTQNARDKSNYHCQRIIQLSLSPSAPPPRYPSTMKMTVIATSFKTSCPTMSLPNPECQITESTRKRQFLLCAYKKQRNRQSSNHRHQILMHQSSAHVFRVSFSLLVVSYWDQQGDEARRWKWLIST